MTVAESQAAFRRTTDISRPTVRAMGCVLWGFGENWPRWTARRIINSDPLSALYIRQWIIGSYIGLLLIRRQTIFWTSDGLLRIGPLGTNFSEIVTKIQNSSFTKCIWKYRLRKGDLFVQGRCVNNGIDMNTLVTSASSKWSVYEHLPLWKCKGP